MKHNRCRLSCPSSATSLLGTQAPLLAFIDGMHFIECQRCFIPMVALSCCVQMKWNSLISYCNFRSLRRTIINVAYFLNEMMRIMQTNLDDTVFLSSSVFLTLTAHRVLVVAWFLSLAATITSKASVVEDMQPAVAAASITANGATTAVAARWWCLTIWSRNCNWGGKPFVCSIAT